MTAFDLAALLIVAVSTLVGFSRGAMRELVTVVAFTLAAIIAVFLLPMSGPLLRRLVHPAWAGAAAAVVVVFLVAYVALRVMGAAITTHLHQTALGVVDRLIGGAFGFLRALVVLGVFALVFNAVTPRGLQPGWITGGPTWPVAYEAGSLLAAVAPKGLSAAGGFGATMGEGVRKGFSATDDGAGADNKTGAGTSDEETGGAATPKALSTVRPQTKGKPAHAPATSYDSQNRRRLDDLVEHTR